MDPVRFKLFFKEKKRFYISVENIVLILLWLFFLSTIYLRDHSKLNLRNGDTIIGFYVVVYSIGLIIANFFRFERVHGSFKGELVLYQNQIKIGSNSFEIKQITSVHFSGEDIKGQSTNTSLRFRPLLSNGIDNKFTITLKNGNQVVGSFQQTKTERISTCKDLLCYYYQQGIINWLHLLQVLEISDYDEIQKLKSKL